jgi:RNA polymerase sigma-70 factor, ECF subfamily
MANDREDQLRGAKEGRPDAERVLRRPGSAGGARDIEADELRVRRLVELAKAGDRDAMRALYLHFAPTVRAYVARIVPTDHDAEDVTQHTFAKLMTELARYEPGAAPFRAWMLRVARNVAIDHRRQARAVPSDGVAAIGARLDDGAIERRVSLREALGSLTAGQRDVLVLRHVVGLTHEEIAARTGRTLRSVYCLHHRGRAAACTALAELESAPATARGREPVRWPGPVELETAA